MSNFPKEYIDYLIHFHGARDYFECHEIMEEFWIDNSRETKWLALIQLAVAIYHERQKNIAGSLRLHRKVLNHIETNPGLFEGLHIHEEKLVSLIKERVKKISDNKPYEPFNLPLTDEKLIRICKEACEEKGWVWLEDDRTSAEDLIFRHKLRDRSDVIQARQDALVMKKQKKEES